jgi:beta-N-acetylhexosaminidase
VTVSGVDDDAADSDQTTSVTLSVVDASSDNDFDILADQTVTVTTTDNDVLPPPAVRDFCNTTGTIWGAPFADVGQSSPVYADVGCLYHTGVVVDDGSGLYRPDDVTTRSEMVAFAARTLGPVRGLCPSRVPPFTDMDSASPIAGELACMYGLGVVRGRTGTTFDPETGVTRAEAAAFISRFYQAVSSQRWSASCSDAVNPFDDATGHWSEPNITCVNALGIITGTTTGTFSPQATVTRAEAATMWKKTLVSLL